MDPLRLILLHGVWLLLALIVIGAAAMVLAGRGQRMFIPRTVGRWITALAGFVLFGIGALGLVAFLFLDVGGTGDALRAMEDSRGRPAPELAYLDLDGTPALLTDLRGRVVLLNFWATWCSPCLAEMPVLDGLQRDYADRGLVVLQLSDEDAGRVTDWLEGNPMTTTHGLLPAGAPPPAPFDAMTVVRPVTFAIDRDGVIRDTAMGQMTRERFERMIRPHL